MHITPVKTRVTATHGVVASFPNDFFGYFGWPTVGRMDDGTLIAAASGLRNAHVCPFGRNVIMTSPDDGKTWTSPRVVNDCPLDDRDTGIVPLGDGKLLMSWFVTDNRQSSMKRLDDMDDAYQVARWREGFARMSDEVAAYWAGAWVRFSGDAGNTWAPPVKVPLTTPHGPIRLRSGALLFLGKPYPRMEALVQGCGAIAAMCSRDDGSTWEMLGSVPVYPKTVDENYHEAHVVELQDGRLIGMIRFQDSPASSHTLEELGLTNFSMMQTESIDGGRTWSPAHPLHLHGSPPHLLLHSTGALVCVYGYRLEPYGQRAMISRDGGRYWEADYILRDDGPDSDLGYPSSVELEDGSILTVYYQKPTSVTDKCSVLWTRWRLDG